MKIQFLGRDYPIVNVTFTSHGVAVTYLDDRSPAPGLKLITMDFEDFKRSASFLDKEGA